ERPVSSITSRAKAAATSSPQRMLPPGRDHQPAKGSEPRCTRSTFPFSLKTTAWQEGRGTLGWEDGTDGRAIGYPSIRAFTGPANRRRNGGRHRRNGT